MPSTIPTPASTTTSGPTVPAGLDPTAYTLTKAIAYKENGGSAPNYNAASGDDGASPAGTTGKYGGGAYQFTTATWQNDALQVLGDANAPMTPENQNQVAYTKVANWLKQGYTSAQVASMWNAGPGEPNAYTGKFSTGAPSDGTNAAGTKFDVPGYVNTVQQYAEQLWNGQTPTPYQAPSVGGFAGNVVKSAANFAGNLGNAVLHPIQTVQGIGSAAVGGLQELGGQQNQNTQDFDAVKSYFQNRYGSMSDLENSLYTDPIGVAADLSTLFAGGAGLADVAGDAARAGTVASAADADAAALSSGVRTMAGDQAIGNSVTRAADAVSGGLSNAAVATNPLTPVIAGASKLGGAGRVVDSAKEGLAQVLGINPYDIDNVMASPDDYTPEKIAAASRTDLSSEIDDALTSRQAQLSDTGAGYSEFRNTPTPIETAPNFLDNAIREAAGVEVNDGVIEATSASKIRAPADIKELQSIYNRYKPDFLQGTIDSNKLLNLRNDLDETADYRKGLSSNLQRVAHQIRTNLNDEYRGEVPGLLKSDTDFAEQKSAYDRLKKGLLDKNGNLTDTAINKIANAANKGKDEQLARLEEISPGITNRIKTLRTIENIRDNGIKVGTYTKSIVQAARLGGVVFGAATGNIKALAAALAADFITNPDNAVPILRAMAKVKPEIVAPVIAKMAQYITVGATARHALGSGANSQQTPTDISALQPTDQIQPQPQTQPSSDNSSTS